MSQPPLYRLPEVLEQMETVGDLPRLRSPFACALGVEPGAVPTDHLDRRMPFEPLGVEAAERSDNTSTTCRRSKSTITVP